MSVRFIDIFCGVGGSSLGLTGAGLELVLAANDWPRAGNAVSANVAHWLGTKVAEALA